MRAFFIASALTVLELARQTHASTCTVHAKGNGIDDAPSLLAAIAKCGRGGSIVLPSENYTIAQTITTHLENATLDLHGYLSFTPNITYWVENAYRFPFQNQSIAWHVTGHDFVVDGHDVGGVFGHGQTWYSWAHGVSNVFGRPISISITNATRGTVKNFRIIQPQFWSSLVWNSSNIVLKDFYVNATNFDTAANGSNWVLNTDGSDSYQSNNVLYENWVYQGGDDCVAFKPNSTQITVRNVTCVGGDGIAFGSIGQYPGVFDIIQDILVEDVVTKPSRQTTMSAGAYFKSWIGVYEGTPPNGGGGGEGYCKNVTIRNLHTEDSTIPLSLTSNLTYSQLNQSYANTSTFTWNDMHFINISGSSSTDALIQIECSSKAPCEGWTFEDINLTSADGKNASTNYVCQNLNATGLNQCRG